MAELSTKIKQYAKANNVNEINFLTDVILKDKGNGAYIAEWNLDIDEPTDEQLASYETAGNTEEANDVVRNTRRLAYPSIGDQLDMIYHAGQGGDAFQAAIKAIKDKYPKG